MVNEKWNDLTLTIDEVLRLGMKWFPVVTAAAFLPYLLLWGLPNGPNWSDAGEAVGAIAVWIVVALPVYGLSAILHELIHAGAMITQGVPLSSIRFGGRLREGVIYVHTEVAMPARSYRVVLLTPAVVQGILPIVAGTVAGSLWVVLYGYIMLASAVGDLAVLKRIRHLAPGVDVQDHPHDIGCRVRLPSEDEEPDDSHAPAG